MCVCVCVFQFIFETTGPTEAMFMWNHHGIGEEIHSNDSGHWLFLIQVLSASGGMAFSTAFTTKVAPQCRAFSMALKIEKIKAPLLRSPKGAGDTKDCYNIATA